MSHHNTDLWRSANPVGGKRQGCGCWAYWPMSSGWLCEHLYTQYEYSLDREFLERTAYPILKEAALFYLAVLEEENGYLAFGPSTSPENSFLWEGEWVAVSRTNAMTMTIIKELFENCRKAGEILGIQDEFQEISGRRWESWNPYASGKTAGCWNGTRNCRKRNPGTGICPICTDCFPRTWLPWKRHRSLPRPVGNRCWREASRGRDGAWDGR